MDGVWDLHPLETRHIIECIRARDTHLDNAIDQANRRLDIMKCWQSHTRTASVLRVGVLTQINVIALRTAYNSLAPPRP